MMILGARSAESFVSGIDFSLPVIKPVHVFHKTPENLGQAECKGFGGAGTGATSFFAGKRSCLFFQCSLDCSG